jgi:hypothetical protein
VKVDVNPEGFVKRNWEKLAAMAGAVLVALVTAFWAWWVWFRPAPKPKPPPPPPPLPPIDRA